MSIVNQKKITYYRVGPWFFEEDMIKSELIETLASEVTHLSEQQISEAVNCILDTMGSALIKGQRIEIRGFGSFTLRKRKPRHAHNPKTGEKITTQEKFSPHFKPGKELRERVDQSKEKYPLNKD
jgi:integration host factor subunit beta